MDPVPGIRAIDRGRSSDVPVLRLDVFGGPRVSRNHLPLSVSTTFAAVLLLIDERGESGLPRQTVCDLLWRPEEETLIRHRFSQLLYGLNRKLGPGLKVTVDDELVVMEEGKLVTDLQAFHQHVALGQLSAAKRLLDLGYAPLLDSGIPRALLDWVEGRRVRVRAQLRERAAGLWSQAETAGQWADAVAASQVMLDLDPNDESVLRNFIWAHASFGRVAEARAAYRSFVERVRLNSDNAGWTASPETQDLVARAKTIGDAHRRRDGIPLAAPPQIAFTGRSEELARVARAVRRTPRDDAGVVIVTGEAGVGKTRILEEALRSAPLDGYTVLRGACSELEREVPLGPILDALSGPAGRQAIPNLGEPWRSVMLGLLPALHEGPGPLPAPPDLQPEALSRRLLEGIRQTLLKINDSGPLILVLDDVHWMDESSAAALDYLRRRWDSEGLTIVLADRPEGRIPGSAAERLMRTLLAARWGVEVVELQELSEGESLALIREARPTGVSDASARRILDRGGPNPFFLVELALAPESGQDPIGMGPPAPIPGPIVEVLAPRIEALSIPARKILLLLSVVQLSIEPKVISRLLALGLEETLSALEEMAEARILDWDRNRAFVRHGLIREMSYCRISPARLAWLHGRAGAFLEARRPDCPPGDLSLHFYRAGESDRALHYATLAADQAEEAGSGDEAVQYLFVALEVCEDPALEADILNRLGELLHQGGHFRDAEEILKRAIPALLAQGRVADSLLAETTRCDALSLIPEQDPLEPIAILKSVRERARKMDAWEPFFITWDVELHIRDRMGDITGAATLLKDLEAIEPPDDPLARSLWHTVLAIKLFYGDPSEAVVHAKEGYGLAAEAGQLRQRRRSLVRLLGVQSSQALLGSPEGQSLLSEADVLFEGRGQLDLRAMLKLNQSLWYLEVAHYDRAITELDMVTRITKQTTSPILHLLLACNRGEALLNLRQYDDAHEVFRGAESLLNRTVPPYYHAWISAGLGLASLMVGQLSVAKERLTETPPMRIRGHYDSSFIALFEARVHARYNRLDAALQALTEAAATIRSRFVTGWIKLRQEHAVIQGLANVPRARKELTGLIDFARGRNLSARVEELETIDRRLAGGN